MKEEGKRGAYQKLKLRHGGSHGDPRPRVKNIIPAILRPIGRIPKARKGKHPMSDGVKRPGKYWARKITEATNRSPEEGYKVYLAWQDQADTASYSETD